MGGQLRAAARFIVICLIFCGATVLAVGLLPDSSLRQILSAFGPTLVGFGLLLIVGLMSLNWYSESFSKAARQLAEDEYARQVEIGRADKQPLVARIPRGQEVTLLLNGEHFRWPDVLAPTISTSALSSDLLFRALKGGFDVPKLALRRVVRAGSSIELELGTAAFRDINLAHYWGFLPLTDESTDEESRAPISLYSLVGAQQRASVQNAISVLEGDASSSSLCCFVPNALGASAFVRVVSRSDEAWYSRIRSHHVAADPGKECPAVAGLIDALPSFSGERVTFGCKELVLQEYEDEFLSCVPVGLRSRLQLADADVRALGFVWDPEKNYQPELYFLVTFRNDDPMFDHAATSSASGLVHAHRGWEINRRPRSAVLEAEGRWRAVDRAAISRLLSPWLADEQNRQIE